MMAGPTQDKWHRVYYWQDWMIPALNAVNGVILAAMLVPCAFYRVALPTRGKAVSIHQQLVTGWVGLLSGRRALRWLWVCVRAFFLLYAVEHLIDYLAWGSFGPVGTEIRKRARRLQPADILLRRALLLLLTRCVLAPSRVCAQSRTTPKASS